MEAWKIDIYKKAVAHGIIKDPQWLEKLNEPMPVWAVLEIAVKIAEKMDPPYATYD